MLKRWDKGEESKEGRQDSQAKVEETDQMGKMGRGADTSYNSKRTASRHISVEECVSLSLQIFNHPCDL